jgi:cell division initiation protein
MEGTSGTPHLLTDVRFSVSRKGYDPNEVDNFLERVSAAVAQLQDKLRQAAAQAESAEVRATEASRTQAGLQQRIESMEAELAAAREGVAAPASRDPEEEAQQASRMLLMAQRTADAAIEEANATARTTLADARGQASTIVGEAQGEADRILSQARAEAEAIVTNRRQTLVEEVRGLESTRDAVTADLAILEQHAADQRAAVEGAVARLQAVLDDPAAFRLGMVSGLSGASVSDVLVDEAGPAESSPGTSTAPSEGWSTSTSTETAPEEEAAETGGPEEATAEPEPDRAQESEPEPGPAADVEPDGGTAPADAGGSDGPPTHQIPAVTDEAASPAEPGTASLFAPREGEASPAGGGGEQPPAPSPGSGGPSLFTPRPEEESALGPPDDDADAAMRAFFEAEFDDDPGRGSR